MTTCVAMVVTARVPLLRETERPRRLFFAPPQFMGYIRFALPGFRSVFWPGKTERKGDTGQMRRARMSRCGLILAFVVIGVLSMAMPALAQTPSVLYTWDAS